MAEISKITLPSGNTYDIKDATARQMIAGGVSFIVAWNGSSTPVPANIPAGVVVTYNGTEYTGTLAAASAETGAFYLVKSSTQKGTLDVYDEYTVVTVGSTKSWEKLGDTQLDLSDLGALAYKDSVTLNKGTGDNVLGEATTFTNAASAVSFSGGATDKVLGSDATFTTTVTPTTTNIKATASGVAVGANGTAAAITGFGTHTTGSALPSNAAFSTTVTPTTSKLKVNVDSNVLLNCTDRLVTTTVPNVTENTNVSIPNVTSAGTASTWSFAMGTGTDAETLIISGGNSTAPTLGTALSASKVTLGTAKTVATGALSQSGTGAPVAHREALQDLTIPTSYSITADTSTGATGIDVVTGIDSASTTASGTAVNAITALGTPTTANALTGVKVTSQPTVALATGATAGTGVISVATGITSATTTTNNKDEVTAVTSVGTATAAAQAITIGTNDKVKVAKYDDLSNTVQ